jgi:hypothetical protein
LAEKFAELIHPEIMGGEKSETRNSNDESGK